MPQSTMRVNALDAPPRTNSRFHETYSPLDERRLHFRRGAHDRWQRLVNDEVPGGWRCACRPLPDATEHTTEPWHRCNIICATVGRGAA